MRDVIMRCPGKNDIDKLKALWSGIFSSVGMDAFFSGLYDNELCSAVFSDNELCAMGYLVPAGKLLCEGEAFDCAMIYSVATAPLYRGKGYAKAVVEKLVVRAYSLGFPVVVLSPSDDALFEFYRENNGFADWFYTDELTCKNAEMPDSTGKVLSLENVSAETYIRHRDCLLSKRTYIKQDVSIFRYQRSICEEVGGGLYFIGDSCAVIEVQDYSIVFVKELLSPDDNLNEVLSAIADAYPAHGYIVRTPATSENSKRFGMVKTEKSIHAGLMSTGFLSWYGLALD